MRITQHINLPEPLLLAQREGKLVIFAGAGISMDPPASLPNFAGLASRLATDANRPGPTEEQKKTLDEFVGRLGREGVDVHERTRRIIAESEQPNAIHAAASVEWEREFRRHLPIRLLRSRRASGSIPPSMSWGHRATQSSGAWKKTTGKTPIFLAAWEEPHSAAFLIAGSPERLPASFETATHQRIVFENLGEHMRARISGPQVPRLRRSPYTAADGVLVPLGFADSGVVHLPLLGSPLHIFGPSAALCIKAVLAFAILRLGESSVEVWSNDENGSITDSRLREKLELEALLRRRLFAEEKVFGFIDHVLENPDDQLPVIIVVVDAEMAASISDLESILVNIGIAIIINGEGDAAVRKILCEEDLTRLDVAGLELMTLEPARVSERVTSFDHGLDGGTAPDLVEIESHESEMTVGEEAAQDHAFTPEANDAGGQIAVETQQEAEVSRKVYCLGGLKIEVDGDVQQKGWRSPALEILAALIGYPKGLSRDQLVSMVWPDSEFSEVERLFYTSISQISSNLRGPADTSKIVLFVEGRGPLPSRFEPGVGGHCSFQEGDRRGQILIGP